MMNASSIGSSLSPPAINAEPTADFPTAEMLCPVVSNQPVNEEYRHMVVQVPCTALAARPGQFFHLSCPSQGADRPYLRRPMSVYRVNRKAGQVEFLYKVQGAGTRGLATLRAGDTLDIMGPVGRGFAVPKTCRHVLIAARGVGLATMAPLAEHAIAQGAHVTAILSARAPELLMSIAYLQAVGAEIVTVHDLDQSSEVDNLEALIRRIHAGQALDYLATCGSNRLLKLIQRLADEWHIPGEVALEQKMGCALGMCFACIKPFRVAPGDAQTHYRRVCWDGPVFNVQETVSW